MGFLYLVIFLKVPPKKDRNTIENWFVSINEFYFGPQKVHHRPLLYTLYNISVVTEWYMLALNFLILSAIIFYILLYVNYLLCSLGVGEKRKILMFWKCHLFQTLFLSYAVLHLHLCCQQACFPKQIQGKSRYAF